MYRKELKNKYFVSCLAIIAAALFIISGCKKDDNFTNPFTGTGSITFNGTAIGNTGTRTDTMNYVNRTASVIFANGYYSKKEGITTLVLSAAFPHYKEDGTHYYDSVYVSLSCKGSGTGTYNWTDRNGNFASVYFIRHNTFSFSQSTGSTTISNYGAVNGKIDGSFQGVVIGSNNDTLNISGNFSANRMVDIDSTGFGKK